MGARNPITAIDPLPARLVKASGASVRAETLEALGVVVVERDGVETDFDGGAQQLLKSLRFAAGAR